METLLEDYKRKLTTVDKMLKEFKDDERVMTEETFIRLNTKASEYRSFIVDIERMIERSKPEPRLIIVEGCEHMMPDAPCTLVKCKVCGDFMDINEQTGKG